MHMVCSNTINKVNKKLYPLNGYSFLFDRLLK
jgi:hypothetical protein